MGFVKISDDLLWVTQIEGDPVLKERISNLGPGDSIDLEVDGVVGHWEKARTGKDGRPTAAVKPVGPMREIWKRFQARRGELVAVRETRSADSYLKALSETLNEWESPEDEEAFRAL